ncbi:MAG: hypothetical protein V3U02_12530 [Calditrichia bacterium]
MASKNYKGELIGIRVEFDPNSQVIEVSILNTNKKMISTAKMKKREAMELSLSILNCIYELISLEVDIEEMLKKY